MFSELEVKRQSVHASLGVLLAFFFYYDVIGAPEILVALCILLFFSYLEKVNAPVPFFQGMIDRLQRRSEKEGLPLKGAIFYLLGAFLAVLLFRKEVAIAAILILAFGDSVSRIVGPYGYVRHPFNNERFMEGIIAGGFLASVIAAQFVSASAAVLGAFVAMMLEGLDIEINNFKIDDNLTIPLVSGIVMSAVNMVI
jgi:dolichol kinase